MALPCSKSPSLAPSRSKPNARNSEINNPMRRSFSGNPFSKPSVIENPRSFNPNTPANSSSDFPRRHSVGGRENVEFFHDADDKENGKDPILKPGKVRSPAAAKNFMSPTISASSKVTNSPRKKVLTERNEPARISISSIDGKSAIRRVTFAEPLIDSDLKPGFGPEEKKPEASSGRVPKEEEKDEASVIAEDLKVEKALLEESKVPLNPKNETESLYSTEVPLNIDNETESSFQTISEEPDCVNLDPTFKLSPTPPPISSTSTILAPLDADPLVPPYDPKTNYLSPRPQFLCYKPNPRVELYKEREGLNLEGNLISASFSDTEVTEETQSEDSAKDSEDVSSDGVVNKEEEGHSSLSSPSEAVEATEVHKARFFTRSNAITLIFLLSIASISFSVINCPVISPTTFEYQTIFSKVYESSEFSEFAKANFDRLARNSHIWFISLKSSGSELVPNFSGGQNLGQFNYYNLTALHEDSSLYQYPTFAHNEKGRCGAPQVDLPDPNVEENEVDVATDIKTAEDFEDVSVGYYDSASEELVQQDMIDVPGVEQEIVSGAPESGEVTRIQLATLLEPSQTSEPGRSEPNMEVQDHHQREAAEIPVVFEEASLEANQAPENSADINTEKEDISLDQQPESEVADVHTEVNDDGTGNIELAKAEENSVSVDADAAFRENQHIEAVNFPPHMLLYVLLFFIFLVAAAASNYSRKDKSRSQNVAETLNDDSSSASKEQVKPSLKNGPTEMDTLGESSTEMSSFEKSSSYSQKGVKEVSEAQSLEKKPRNRRESLASSSSDYSISVSTSYGSFTTFEKLSNKHGQGDEETVTPVRRSSRIRNQATSPLRFG